MSERLKKAIAAKKAVNALKVVEVKKPHRPPVIYQILHRKITVERKPPGPEPKPYVPQTRLDRWVWETLKSYTPEEVYTPSYKPSQVYTPSYKPSQVYTPDYTPAEAYTPSYKPTEAYTPSYTPSQVYTPSYTPSQVYTPDYTPEKTYTQTVYSPEISYRPSVEAYTKVNI